MRILAYLILSLILSSSCVFAQNELGSPYIKNFNSKKHKFSETVWDITQDNKGLMYFGAGDGIHQYDGANWRTIPVDNESTIRSLDVDSNGRVYVGAKGEFGYISEDSLGYPVYVSLSKELEEKYKTFSDVWNLYVTNQGVFFLSFERVFKWANNQLSVYEIDDITAHLGFYVNDNLYLVRQKKGLYVFKNNEFIPTLGGEYYIGKTIFSILDYNEENVIVATRTNGLELYNIKTGEVKPFINDVNEQLKTNRIYHGAISENGEYIFGTLNNGIYVVDRKGKLVTHVAQQNGLQSNNIKYIYKDYFGGIWLGNAMGLSYVELNLPLTSFNSENGINGYTRDVIRFKNEIYVATENGVYYLDTLELNFENKFKPIYGANGQFFSFLKVDDKLLVASDRLYEISNKILKKISTPESKAVFSMLQSEKHPNFIYLALKNGISIVEVLPTGEIKSSHKFYEFDIECKYLAEDKEGNLLISTAFDYLIKIESSSFNKEAGFPLTYKKYEYGARIAKEQVIKINNQILFSSENGLLIIDKNDKFKKSNSFNIENLPEEYLITEVYEDFKNNLWIHYHFKKATGVFLAIKTNNNSYIIKNDPFTRVGEKISHTNAPYFEENGVAWFFGGEGIVRYDYNKDLIERKRYQANIRKVTLKSDSIIDYGGNNTLNKYEYSFDNNSASFTFSAATYGNEDEIFYQYFLVGHDNDWSDWTPLNTKEYSYLHENTYTFKVRAKNVYNQISEEDEFSFVILPPWYREVWAYIVYIVGFFILIFLIIKVATYRLNQSKKQLEVVVEKRTKDIVVEKEKVEQQKLQLENIHEELSERNKDVMDSIKYAQRIQSSILPSLDKLKVEFDDSFVLYKPRDIVSGDFYWYEKVGDFFVMACADCTGHGVPGAFMSMIGTTLLNKIIEKDEVLTCEDALTQLDQELQKTLQQTKISENEIVMDGMDISLIAVNLKTKECHYSGAYRPLYLLRNNEVIVYNSNRLSIGGGFTKDKHFKGENIAIQSGDQIYMFTDGVVDQFGGEKNKKFKRERLKQLLLDFCDKNMEIQSKEILNRFENWRGENEQIDDVLIMGIKIP